MAGKRSGDSGAGADQAKRQKTKTKTKYLKSAKGHFDIQNLAHGTAGAILTCSRNMEKRCVAEAYDLLNEVRGKVDHTAFAIMFRNKSSSCRG
jgi:hypothetical protein